MMSIIIITDKEKSPDENKSNNQAQVINYDQC